MNRYATLRVSMDDLDALNDALATGEGVAQAAQKIVASPTQSVTLFEGPEGTLFRVESNGQHPVALMLPQLTEEGEVSIPVRLKWYKGEKLTEARGPTSDARRLIEALQELL